MTGAAPGHSTHRTDRPMKHLVLFDLDGTLVDHESAAAEGVEQWLIGNGWAEAASIAGLVRTGTRSRSGIPGIPEAPDDVSGAAAAPAAGVSAPRRDRPLRLVGRAPGRRLRNVSRCLPRRLAFLPRCRALAWRLSGRCGPGRGPVQRRSGAEGLPDGPRPPPRRRPHLGSARRGQARPASLRTGLPARDPSACHRRQPSTRSTEATPA